MPYYTEIQTTNFGPMTQGCGAPKLADRLANTDSTTAGDDFAYVYHFDINITQPHNETGAANASSAPFSHDVILTLPDYEPIVSNALVIMNAHDVIQKLTLNITNRQGTQGTLLGQYTMKNGILIGYAHHVQDQRDPEALKHRGEVKLKLRFNDIQFQNNITQTQGVLQTSVA